MIDHVSYSRLSTYERCPRLYYLRYVKQAPEERGVPLLFGVLIHEVLEAFYRWVVAEEYAGPLPHPVLYEMYQRAFERSELAGSDVYGEGKRLLAEFVMAHPEVDHLDVLAVEQAFDVEVGVRVTGRIDRVDRVGDRVTIIDYKTGRLLQSREELDSDLQLSIYAIAAARLYPWAEQVTLVLEMLRHRIELRTERDADALAHAAEYVVALARRIESEREFPAKVGGICATCGQQANCSAYQKAVADPGGPAAVELADVDAVIAERERVSGLAKILYARQKELDDVIKERIEESGPIQSNGRVYDVVRAAFDRDYPVEVVAEFAAAADVDAREAGRRLLVVDPAAVDRWLRELRNEIPPVDHQTLSVRLDAAVRKRYTQRLSSRRAT